MKLRLLRAYRAYKKGDVVEFPSGISIELLRSQYAVVEAQQELLETASVEVQSRQADITPRRRRRQ